MSGTDPEKRVPVTDITANPGAQQNIWQWLASSDPRNVLATPFIYLMSLPFVLLDLSISIYQHVCFPLFKIPRVSRHSYMVFDRHHLYYLNNIEKVHCLYCSYINGLVAYAKEIVGRTEQYWCPVKHAEGVLGAHRHYDKFADYGVEIAYPEHLRQMREAARNITEG